MTFADAYLKAIYRVWARVYDKHLDAIFGFDRKRVIDALSIKKGERILEIGVGTGLNLVHYPAHCRVTGIDFSKAMLDKAAQKKTGADVRLRVADARDLPFKDDSFNAALATYVLRVSPEPRRIMHEASRVVKPKGRFVILDQFRGKNTAFLAVVQPLKLLLGWGKEYDIDDLLQKTPWRIVSNTRIGRMDNTRLIVLKNRRRTGRAGKRIRARPLFGRREGRSSRGCNGSKSYAKEEGSGASI